MPPKTRRSGGAASANQSTLSFKNKITKSSTAIPDAAAHRKAQKLHDPAQEQVAEAVEIAKPSTPEPDAEEQQKSPVRVAIRPSPSGKEEEATPVESSPSKRRRKSRKSADYETDPSESYADAEKAAKKISDAQIKKYWKAEEDNRLAPRVHQGALPMHEKILRHFDLSSQFGPCIGITRLARWKRAHSLSQSPPLEVLAVLLKEEEAEKDPKKHPGGRQCGKLAYIDELAGGRVVLVE